jgi:hypothetical protein
MSCIFNQDQTKACGTSPIGGLYEQAIYEYNYSQWREMVDAGLVTFAVNGSITAIVNEVGIKAYKKDVPNMSITLGSTPNKVAGAYTTFTHLVNYPLINNKQLEKNVVESMTDEKRVIIVIKNSGEAEIYGNDQGLILINTPYNPNDPVLGGMIPVELSTDPDGAKETRMPRSIFITDTETTIALIKGLTEIGT